MVRNFLGKKFREPGPQARDEREARALIHLKNGTAAVVTELKLSDAAMARLEAMGIVVGADLVKKTAALAHGPVVIRRGSTDYAIGYELASEIYVRPLSASTRGKA